ncbi:hypothetical protein HPB49_023119 [Dermacentor silvarum]|uniref:Uncharacterized protein n=1 Tax=Dermacentor silvarum TaxID=543639 RepID=A0ACB8E3X8_DERSI|nr:hypothetical protein HPB49_023119 [Dermacentor silvarum]
MKERVMMSMMLLHALLLPVLVCHLRFHKSLDFLESIIGTEFKDRYLLQNFGTNPDHARNSLSNCGIRQPEYGDRRIHYLNTRKRGINTLINIMSRFGRQEETASSISHNERLEFLGDAVVEFLSSIHLFFMFPDLEEGGLATYRAAIVQNQHLAVLAKKLELEKYMLYAHGSDLCHDLELRHAMANCFEALMGALFLDSGIKVADRVFSTTLFSEPDLLDVWVNYPPHPLQEQVPEGDRKWIDSVPLLKANYPFHAPLKRATLSPHARPLPAYTRCLCAARATVRARRAARLQGEPCWFRNYVPLCYRHNAKAWMTRDLLAEWLDEFDRDMQRQGRHVLLVLNCSAHHVLTSLMAVTRLFLPPNTTSKVQPLDLSKIHAFKP